MTGLIDLPYLKDICRPTSTKIIMLVVDGFGGLARPDTGKSELETADLPNLDALARRSACGLTTPVAPGVTPGSGPGHMALFGYDPVKYLMGRGVLEALGIDVEMRDGDVAARGNLCTVDPAGRLTDRRAGRIPTSESLSVVELLNRIEVPGVEIEVFPVRDYRFVLRLRGDGLSGRVRETDPQEMGRPPLEAAALAPEAAKTARAVNAFVEAASRVIGDRERANMVLLRGFSKLPRLPAFGEAYNLSPAAVAAYPMYRGLASLVGMEVLSTGQSFADELSTVEEHFDSYDFFFLHYKPADAAGEDGDFDAKVSALEDLDAYIPRLLDIGAETLVVAGDHSTPALMAGHSWHPVPLLICSSSTKGQGINGLTESACGNGQLGRLPATSVMMIAMAHAGKLTKFGP